jgi:hypothetical protein
VAGGGKKGKKKADCNPLLIVHILKMPLIMAKNKCKKSTFAAPYIFPLFTFHPLPHPSSSYSLLLSFMQATRKKKEKL